MQAYPAFWNLAAAIFIAAKSISALSSIITGHFPPSSNIHGIRFSAATFATNFPFSVEPVKHIRSNGYFPIFIETSKSPNITL